MIFRRTKNIFCVLFIIAVFAGNCFSQALGKSLPSIEPLFLPEDVLGASNNTSTKLSLSADEIFKLSLLFSECSLESPEGRECLAIFENIKTEVCSQEYKKLEPEDRGRAILKLLYRDYLKSYRFNQTRTNVALKTGVYNCVSSAILYLAAVKAAGLDVRGQKTPDHAFCTVYIPGNKNGQYKKIDVETTNPYGFNPGSKEAVENEDKIQGYYVVPKKFYTNRQEVSDRIFTGLIAGNICADCIENNDYNKAISVGAARYLLVRNEQSKAATQARHDFDVLAGNYINTNPGSAVVSNELLDWFTSFIDRWGITEFLQQNMDNAMYNLLVLCTQEKNLSLAAASFEKNKKYLTQKEIATSQEIITDIILDINQQEATGQSQIELINDFLSNPDYQEEAFQNRAKLYLENAWLSVLNKCMNIQAYEEGYEKSAEALESLPQSSKIKKMQKSFYDNCIVLIHNKFADQANAGNYDKARFILEEGLQKYPDDKTLKSDLTLLNKRTSN